MPKTENNLYDKITDFDNLLEAYRLCRLGKRYSIQAMEFADHLEENLINIHRHLVCKTWTTGIPHRFTIREPKIRDVCAPPFADRVVHHALMLVCSPIFQRRFIKNSFACQKGKGTQAAVKKVQQFIRSSPKDSYVIKADVKKCFNSLHHDEIMIAVERVISCRDTLNLFREVFKGYGNDFGVGIPIGSLTSQWACNLLLDRVDHAMTDKHGFGHYVRYMDDIIIVIPDKQKARDGLELLEIELQNIKLELNPKSKISPAKDGVDFAGYRTFATHILPRKRVIEKARKCFKETPVNWARVKSFMAYCKHCNSYTTVTHILNNLKERDKNENY